MSVSFKLKPAVHVCVKNSGRGNRRQSFVSFFGSSQQFFCQSSFLNFNLKISIGGHQFLIQVEFKLNFHSIYQFVFSSQYAQLEHLFFKINQPNRIPKFSTYFQLEFPTLVLSSTCLSSWSRNRPNSRCVLTRATSSLAANGLTR